MIFIVRQMHETLELKVRDYIFEQLSAESLER